MDKVEQHESSSPSILEDSTVAEAHQSIQIELTYYDFGRSNEPKPKPKHNKN